MLCAISGEAPEEPVVSKKSGAVFEKRLIEKYVEENGKDPVSGEELDLEDLLPIKTDRTVRPRPPTLTSIPALLSQFQNEWDSLAIETYNLREQLSRTREELATALYQHDAAVRVIARLTKERNDARDALSKVTVSGSAPSNDDAMAVDVADTLPDYLSELVDETQAKLSKTRKKRATPAGWTGVEDISSYQQIRTTEVAEDAASMAYSPEYTVVGSKAGDVTVFSNADNEPVHSFNVGSAVTELLLTAEGKTIAVGTAKGDVKLYGTTDGTDMHTFTQHAGPVTGLALHPSNSLLLSVGADKSFAFHNLDAGATVFRKYTTAAPLTTCAFHPDGHLFAVGTQQGAVDVYSTKTGESMASFSLGGETPVSALAFSENGYWFACGSDASPNVVIFDLRKEGAAARVKELPTTGAVRALAWDYSAQFLAVAGAGGVAVHYYAKSGKAWSVAFQSGERARDVVWGDKAQTLSALGDGQVLVLGRAD